MCCLLVIIRVFDNVLGYFFFFLNLGMTMSLIVKLERIRDWVWSGDMSEVRRYIVALSNTYSVLARILFCEEDESTQRCSIARRMRERIDKVMCTRVVQLRQSFARIFRNSCFEVFCFRPHKCRQFICFAGFMSGEWRVLIGVDFVR